MISAVGFDLDNTLYPQDQHLCSFFRVASAWLARERGLDAAQIEQAFLDTCKRRTSYYPRLFDEALDRFGLATPDRIGALVARYHAHRADLSLYPGVGNMLARLRKERRLFMVTDGNARMQRNKVHELGLEGAFDAIVFTHEHGREWHKPSALPMAWAAEAVHAPPSECVYVGDNPHCDAAGARQIGMSTIRVLTGPLAAHCPEPGQEFDVTVEDVLQVEAALSTL
ncbi:MAG TPA: HAD hydrolase-like protein [Armatimonadota bacterium]